MNETPKGMKREDKSDKLNFFDYIDIAAMYRYGRHMKKNEHHGRGNWKKGGYPLNEYLESMLRHLFALRAVYEATGHTDEGEDHAAALMFNVIAFMREERALGTIANRLEQIRNT